MARDHIHPTALIHPDARIGEQTKIGPYAVIEGDTDVGANCRIEAHAVVKRHTRMGNGNHVFEGAVLGGIPQDLKYSGSPSRLEIGDGNVFRENVTVNRSTEVGGVTRLGDRNYLMTCAHVAHECSLEDDVIMANNVALAGHVHIESKAFLSGGVVVHQFTRIGTLAMVGGNAKVTQDVLPFFLVDGVPARTRSLNLVGLQRAGYSRDAIRALKSAYRILSGREGRLQDRLQRLEKLEAEPVERLIRFIRGSERGFCRFA